jgi:hypothetical protein
VSEGKEDTVSRNPLQPPKSSLFHTKKSGDPHLSRLNSSTADSVRETTL